MAYNQNQPKPQSDLKYSIPLNHHRMKILAILRSNLSTFAKEFVGIASRGRVSPENTDIKDENYISGELTFFLNSVDESGYIFQFQAVGPDILVRHFDSLMHSPALFLIEAKRLPPTSSNDYVKKGIGRFKKEEHGKQYDIAAMLGYVQENNFNHWFDKVNSWVTALISDKNENPKWTTGDKIREVRTTDVGEYKSEHSRITKNPIMLYHFWINLCNN
jgi:hypothetical protein